jgi:hypothetical protein
MKWYHYIFCFLGGAFVANFVPHFVHGISGEMFPTPFANPPGRGLSPAIVNVLWALANLAVGYLLLWRGRFALANRIALLTAFVGFSAMAINLSIVFAGVPR